LPAGQVWHRPMLGDMKSRAEEMKIRAEEKMHRLSAVVAAKRDKASYRGCEDDDSEDDLVPSKHTASARSSPWEAAAARSPLPTEAEALSHASHIKALLDGQLQRDRPTDGPQCQREAQLLGALQGTSHAGHAVSRSASGPLGPDAVSESGESWDNMKRKSASSRRHTWGADALGPGSPTLRQKESGSTLRDSWPPAATPAVASRTCEMNAWNTAPVSDPWAAQKDKAGARESTLDEEKHGGIAPRFDEAILAAVAALPAQALIDVLQRLSQQRPHEVKIALGGLDSARPLPRSKRSPTQQVAVTSSAYSQSAAPLPLVDAPALPHLDVASRLESGADRLQHGFGQLFSDPLGQQEAPASPSQAKAPSADKFDAWSTSTAASKSSPSLSSAEVAWPQGSDKFDAWSTSTAASKTSPSLSSAEVVWPQAPAPMSWGAGTAAWPPSAGPTQSFLN
jgi:hypothetical protein